MASRKAGARYMVIEKQKITITTTGEKLPVIFMGALTVYRFNTPLKLNFEVF